MNGRYLIAIDGTQKFYRDEKWEEECLSREVGTDGKKQYYVYVLEAVLILDNGITLPITSEFLKNEEYQDEKSKQDCYTVIRFIPMFENMMPHPMKYNGLNSTRLKKSG